jgi:glycosyltransferase involved in cell wall biosynthesis
VGGAVELVREGHRGMLFERGNVEQLAAAMRALVENPTLRQRLGAYNLTLVRERCCWRVAAQRCEQLFRAAAGIDEDVIREDDTDGAPMRAP